MSRGRIVDSQIHIWAADRPDRPWPAAGWDGKARHVHREVPLGAEEVLAAMDDAGVARAILVPPSWEGYYNDVVLAAARACPGRFAAMGRFAPETPVEALRTWREEPGLLGVRLIVPPGAALAAVDHSFWSTAAELDVPLMLHPVGQNALVAAIAERHPGLRLALDHMGTGLVGEGLDEFAQEDEVLALAARPNICVKLSAMPCHSRRPGRPWADMTPRLRRLVDAFGPQRCFWGSDLSRLPCAYKDLVDHFTQDLTWLSGEDLRLVMGEAILRWLRWD
ncbi:MAG TPA: amidohydrolase family protein [Phenylobacterium sp.]|uniref:amidohydrolase family protein n=1 Tax=Phenylobacterium sp. TaxID=1871053 RepID=UPI002B45F287|nr:amidohydrolase family protein [Phenylobacterium sp.]HKR90276.1 amidohydrolase family protein [Phenylobacterium sp.]